MQKYKYVQGDSIDMCIAVWDGLLRRDHVTSHKHASGFERLRGC
jgi:hypothetical protein